MVQRVGVFFNDLVKEKEVSDTKAGLPNVFGPKKKTNCC